MNPWESRQWTLITMDGQRSMAQYVDSADSGSAFEFEFELIGGRYSSVDRYAETN
jgi:hypothetical protein